MTDLERLELALRSIKVDDTWTPSQLLEAIIKAITHRNVEWENELLFLEKHRD